ncbi:MAG: DUF1232 domain-containing protein [Roseiflexus sp.]|jgi:hypothetical protein|nr:DUF1232 domain-containing protein [Roseiflexus sp.]MBO9333503.1 DUF1232 domain-containing protein [Roseiflexus sp.]MBO9363764.1 DUF1232 domain-containing protein [Roseiflexus sp.]MBO9383382.1 DUF1232 domain-containing protein [Roseiflexus sp.]MBO9389111.1 DUF1232 domain-containing protein [Roseiflexus sp.]
MNRPWQRRLIAFGAIALGIVCLINPTAGVLELIPDALPFVGNLDEATATALVIWGTQAWRQASLALPALPEKRNPSKQAHNR